MTNSTSSNDGEVWQLDGACARLGLQQLQGDLNLLAPNQGLSNLIFFGQEASGSILGIRLGSESELRQSEINDVYVRGSDLVVTYGPTGQRPFSLQVYYRATVDLQGYPQLDVILSWQTDLLESFPNVVTASMLPTATVWRMDVAKQSAKEVVLATDQQTVELTDVDALLFRDNDARWSYAEWTLPEDRGITRISSDGIDPQLVQRELGGRFLEKGVIRRLRVYSVILPVADDINAASECVRQSQSEQPPLTA